MWARGVEALAWAVVAVAVWLSTASTVTGQEILLAVLAGAVVGAAAVGGRIALRRRWRVRGSWFLRAARLPAAVVIGTATVLVATLRRRPRPGTIGHQRPTADADDPVDRGYRALGSLAMASVPTSYVVDTDADSGTVTVHRLADRGPDWARVGLREE